MLGDAPQHQIQRPGGGRGKKHEIYGAAFGGHLFYDLFLQGWGGMAPSAPHLDPLLRQPIIMQNFRQKLHENESIWT